MIYTHLYKVPTWIVINKLPKGKRKKVQDFFVERRNAKLKVWPTEGFGDYLLTFRKKGYQSHLPEQFPYIVDSSLLLRAAGEHVKNVISVTSHLGSSFSVPAHRLNRKVEKKEDLDELLNLVLGLEDEVGLSQMFQVAEDCFTGTEKDKKMFVTLGPVPLKILTKIADKVITIGDEPNNTLVTSDVSYNDIDYVLNKFAEGEKL